ncbi:MAG: response regulator receiver protein [uncultured bacterium]|nr:MAG: response regulator receiver protein [uncultured bacterium]
MSTKIAELVITKDNLLKGLDKTLADYQVAALTRKNGQNIYDYVTNSNEITLEYQPTVLSPKKFFFPQEEVLLEYTPDGKVSARIDAKPLVLFGIRPCDLNGFKMLYEAFADDHGDPNYLAKLEQTVVIGIDCKKICDKDAFCFKVGSQDAKGGFDVMLYEIGDDYAIETATEKGSKFIAKYLTTSKAKGDEIANFQAQKDSCFGKETPFKNLEKFPETFEANKRHPIWDQEGSRCLSCGSCIMVCPTCYCFDVKDEWQLNLKKGERTRKWDACMVSSFATVGSGENFRHSATARLHHRIDRKFNFLMKKHGQSACVGCGRCVRACLAEISPKKIAEAINGN